MISQRFGKRVWITRHAERRMTERNITPAEVLDVIETGTSKDRGAGHFLVFKHYPRRQDNLLCVALLESDAIIVKTVMHHFSEEQA
jgi:hypothetical protein